MYIYKKKKMHYTYEDMEEMWRKCGRKSSLKSVVGRFGGMKSGNISNL